MGKRILILAVILAIAAALRLYALDRPRIWIDELISLQLSCGRGAVEDNLPRDTLIRPIAPADLAYAKPFWQIPRAMEQETHPPLYSMTLRLWRHAFGDGIYVARALSVAWSLLAVLFLFECLRLTSGFSVAVCGAMLMAVASSQIEFAHEARSHAMLVALVLACCWAGLRIEKHGASVRRIIILILLLVSAMLTHYYAAHGLLALSVYLVLRLEKRERRRVLMGFCIAAVIFCAVWGPSMWHQRGNFTTNLTWSQEASGGNLSRTLLRAAALPVRYLILPGRSDRWLTCGSAVMYLLPALLLRKHPGILLWWMMMLISVGAVAAADVTRSGWMLELLRYTAVASPAMCALLAILLCGADAKRGWILCIALTLVVGSTLSHTYNYTHENYGGIGDYLRPRMSRDDALVIIDTPWYPAANNAFYLAATYQAREIPKVLIVLTKPADDPTLQQLRGCRRVWVIDGSQADFGRMLGGAVAQQGDFFPRVGTVQAVVIP